MTEGQIKEFLTTGVGTEGQLLLPRQIYSVLIDAVVKKRIDRSLAAIYVGPAGVPGSSLDVDLVDADSSTVYQVAEGAGIPIGVRTYSTFNVKPDKYAVRPLITREMMEDAKWDLLAHNIEAAGRELGENETSIIITQALDQAGNTVSGGAAITLANITRAMQFLEDNDFAPTDMLCGPEVMNDLRNISTLIQANTFGSREFLGSGFIGNLYGMNLYEISGGLMTSTSSYIIDRTQAFIIVEKRPVTVERYDDTIHDMSGAVCTQRIRCRHIRANSIAKITTT